MSKDFMYCSGINCVKKVDCKRFLPINSKMRTISPLWFVEPSCVKGKCVNFLRIEKK